MMVVGKNGSKYSIYRNNLLIADIKSNLTQEAFMAEFTARLEQEQDKTFNQVVRQMKNLLEDF